MMAMLPACNSKKADGSKNDAVPQYASSLSDSIKNYESEIESLREQESVVNDQVNVWLRDFTTVAKPREAGSYMIMTSWQNRYPLTATGLVARINDNGGFELVAALTGGNFTSIEVSGPAVSETSEVVPHDQALNYRAAGLNTVMFTGERADSIGALIADNELNPLTVTFLQGKKVQTWKLPAEYAKMISYTYLLYSNKKNLVNIEGRIKMLQEKIKIIRVHQNELGDSVSTAR